MGGAVELWERRTDGGLGCEEKTDSEEGQSIGFKRGECVEGVSGIYLMEKNKSDLKIKNKKC